MLAVFKKEMRSYFTSVIGYVFLVLYLALAGAIFAFTTFFSMSSSVTEFYSYMIVVSAIVLPLLTMKSFSEERKAKTEQLLLTAPVSIPSMVVGKFLASYAMFAGALIFNSLYFLILIPYGEVKFPTLIGNVIALLLVGMVFITIGLFVSSLTENQLSAAVGTIAIILVLLVIGLVGDLVPTDYWIRYVLDSISVFTRFQSFTNGYLDFAALLYYISVAAIFLFLTVRVYDARRYN